MIVRDYRSRDHRLLQHSFPHHIRKGAGRCRSTPLVLWHMQQPALSVGDCLVLLPEILSKNAQVLKNLSVLVGHSAFGGMMVYPCFHRLMMSNVNGANLSRELLTSW